MDEGGDVFGVEVVAVRAAVGLPEVVVVDFGGIGLLAWEDLSVDGAVFLLDRGDGEVGLELGGGVAAVVGGYLKVRSELLDEALLEGVGEAVVVGVLRLGEGGEKKQEE